MTGTLSDSYSISKQESEGMIVSKPFINNKVHPGLAPSSNPPESPSQKVVYYNPFNETISRLEEQNLKALGALTQLTHLIDNLVELNHNESKKMDQLAKTQDILLDDHHISEKKHLDHFETIEKSQDLFHEHQIVALDHLNEITEHVKEGSTEVKEIKEMLASEKLGERLDTLLSLVQKLHDQNEKENETVLEAASLQNLLLEEITRKQTELEKGQRKGFKGILEKLNIIKSDNDKSHDIQLENQKLMVNSLFQLVNEENAMEELKELFNEQ